jgi:hypothetical protein
MTVGVEVGVGDGVGDGLGEGDGDGDAVGVVVFGILVGVVVGVAIIGVQFGYKVREPEAERFVSPVNPSGHDTSVNPGPNRKQKFAT